MGWRVIHGDCIEAMRALPDNSLDSCVTDPPYGLSGEPNITEVLTHWLVGDDYVHRGGGFMGRDWDSFVPGPAYWLEVYRVLKPGAHLLSFGGTRTYDLLCIAVRLAGFEIRDTIAWLQGGGFPKSLDVAKQIDKAADYKLKALVRRAAVAAVEEAGLALPGNSRWDWTIGEHAPGDAWWAEFQAWLPGLSDMERERVEGEIVARVRKTAGWFTSRDVYDVTAPATPEAKRWAGWGSALKPSHEPVVVAQKPLQTLDFLALIGSHLDTLETWLAQAVDPTTPTGGEDASSAPMDTSRFASTGTTFLSTVTSWRKCWAEIWTVESTSTTSTTTKPTTDLRTLWSSLSEITRASTTPDLTQTDGWRSLVLAADNLFAVAVLSSRATRALSVAEIATGTTLTSSPDEDATSRRPAHEPIVVARKPLSGTIAQTVLAHGTGALNVDACRIGYEPEDQAAREARTGSQAGRAYGSRNGISLSGGELAPVNPAGRWPANVCLDESAAAHLDEMTGTQIHGAGAARDGSSAPTVTEGNSWLGTRESDTSRMHRYGDSGGASRFLYVAKSSTAERNAGLPEGMQASHPTVKPISLMRWLVRLVTPPGRIGCVDCSYATDGRDMPGVWDRLHTAAARADRLFDRVSAAGSGPGGSATNPHVPELRAAVQEAPADVLLGGMSSQSATPSGIEGVPDLRDDVLQSRRDADRVLKGVCGGASAQAASYVSRVPGEPGATRTDVLFPDVRGDGDGPRETGQWAEDDAPRLHKSVSTGSSDGGPGRVCDGAPADCGRTNRTIPAPVGGRPSRQRDPGRQPPGESHRDDKAGARRAAEASVDGDRMPALSGQDRHVECCPQCGGALAVQSWPGRVLDPFAGSGTTLIAATLEGFDCIGIEREAEYCAIAEARCAWWARHPDGMTLVKRLEHEKARAAIKDSGQGSIFDLDWDGEAA